MTFNEFLKTHKVNGYALADVQGIHYLSDQDIQLLKDVWDTAINAALLSIDNIDFTEGGGASYYDVSQALQNLLTTC